MPIGDIAGYVWVAYDDACPLCRDMQGEEFSIDDMPALAPGDVHNGCVCYWDPIPVGEEFHPNNGREFDEQKRREFAEFFGTHPPVTGAHFEYTAQMARMLEADPFLYFDIPPEALMGNEAWLLSGLLLAGAIDTQGRLVKEYREITHEDWGEED